MTVGRPNQCVGELKGMCEYVFYKPYSWSYYDPSIHTMTIRQIIKEPRDLMYYRLRGVIRGWTGFHKGMLHCSVVGPEIQGHNSKIEVLYNASSMTYSFNMRWKAYSISEKLTQREIQERFK